MDVGIFPSPSPFNQILAKLVASQASLALHQMCVPIKSFSGVAIGWAGCATWSLVKACVAEQVAFHLFLALIVFS